MYAPMRSEVDVVPFARAAYARGWEACFPCMVRDEPGQPARMVFFRVPAQRFDLAQKAFLSTPLRCFARTELMGDGCDEAAPETLDFVAVPLVAFDDRGNRLGYGGGNYDRLLPLLRPDACTAGVAFAEQRVDAVPTEPHDQLLARIVCA